MKRVCIVCEGQTEETFIREVVAPAFLPLGLNLIGETIETSTGHKGGGLSYERVQKHLRNRLRQASAPIVTTLFDLYRLDTAFPGFREAEAQNGLDHRLRTLNAALHADIVAMADCMPDRFIPFIQPHEFEALLFSDVAALTTIEQGWMHARAALQLARDSAESPEHINHGPETKPAARLERELRNPHFHKRRHGPIAAQRIGLDRIIAECRFFSGWIESLRALANQA